MGKKNKVEGLLLIGDFTIPATITIDVELDVQGAGLIDVLFSHAEDAPEPEVPEEDAAETVVVDETAQSEAPADRVAKVRAAIREVYHIHEGNVPADVRNQLPGGYTLAQASDARARILRTVEGNLTEENIGQFADNIDAFLRQVNATWGGDKVVAEFIHSRLSAAARS